MKRRHDRPDGPCRNFAKGLRVVRQKRGWTQKALTIEVWGVEVAYSGRVSNIETSRHGLTLTTAYLLAKALGTTIDAVIAAGEKP